MSFIFELHDLEEFSKTYSHSELLALHLVSTLHHTDFVVPEALSTLIVHHSLSHWTFGLPALRSSAVFTNAILLPGLLAKSLGSVERMKTSEWVPPRKSKLILILPSN